MTTRGGEVDGVTGCVRPLIYVLEVFVEVAAADLEPNVVLQVAIISKAVDCE